LGQRDSIDIWIVDGAVVRRDIFPDFGLSGNDLAYRFIPAREIWIDGQISCEETNFSIAGELHERMLMRKGMSYDSAYEASLTVVESLRNEVHEAARKKGGVRVTSLKERGTIF
jgi:hypothetical protein